MLIIVDNVAAETAEVKMEKACEAIRPDLESLLRFVNCYSESMNLA